MTRVHVCPMAADLPVFFRRFSAGPERQFQNHHIADPYAPVGQGLSR